MIARIQQSMREKDKGFTLIELLVVIIIIGILAAIAIPVFLNQREKAVDTGIKSDLRTIANELESYYVDHQEYPEEATVTGVGKGDPVITVGTGGATVTKSHDDTVFNYTNNGNSFSVTGVNTDAGTDTTFEYDSAAGGLQD